MSTSIEERGKSLEDAFFKAEEAKKLERFRAAKQTDDLVKDLAEASGLDDTDALEPLAKLGVKPDTIAAIALVPLIHVAWADGVMQPSERKAILDAADHKGIDADSPAAQLLSAWLDEKPSAELFSAWRDYIGALRTVVDPPVLDELREKITTFARDIAKSAGGFLGLKAVSKDEDKALADIEAAFKKE